jgi:hypothetical protein
MLLAYCLFIKMNNSKKRKKNKLIFFHSFKIYFLFVNSYDPSSFPRLSISSRYFSCYYFISAIFLCSLILVEYFSILKVSLISDSSNFQKISGVISFSLIRGIASGILQSSNSFSIE